MLASRLFVTSSWSSFFVLHSRCHMPQRNKRTMPTNFLKFQKLFNQLEQKSSNAISNVFKILFLLNSVGHKSSIYGTVAALCPCDLKWLL